MTKTYSNKKSAGTALIIGGIANALSVIRSLGRKGIRVYLVSGHDKTPEKSRYVYRSFREPETINLEDYLNKLLVNNDVIPDGSVIFPCSDQAIAYVAKYKATLSDKYIFDLQNSTQQLQLLDKQETLKLGKHAGCSTPGFWRIDKPEDLDVLSNKIQFPVLIKPIFSHIFQHTFKQKLFLIENKDELFKRARDVFSEHIEFFICEFIPGPDDDLSSYYTYIDENGERMFEYTKRIFRRAPKNFGGGTYHESLWQERTANEGRKFFEGIGFHGLGNIEFKLDRRDNKLKVIECNARFTAAQELITQSGVDMPSLIYDYLTRGIRPGKLTYKDHVTLLMPFDDFDAYRDLSARGEITFYAWLKSISKPQVFCYLSMSDLLPFMYSLFLCVNLRIKFLLNKLK